MSETSVDRKFADFKVNDFVSFTKSFDLGQARAFSELSGDKNPLHLDAVYANKSEFGKPIVPVHLVAAPLSAIAGMMLPGHRSLYLGSEMRALRPVFYGDDLTYSARVESKTAMGSVLCIKALAFRGIDVVLDANLRVKVRDDNEDNMRPKGDDEIKIENLDDKKIALVTGANGSLGCSIAMTLARNGWNLLLQYRNETKKLEEIKSIVLGLGRECTRIKADLSTEKGVAAVARKASRDRNLMALIHTASPQLNDTLESMMSVNFSALVTITKAILPSMLRQQRGCVLQIGSSALQFVPPGLENYIAAKSAAAVFTDSIGIRFKEYGISGITVAPGYVDTPYSNSIRSVGKALLIKEEVADVVADAVNSVQVGSADASSYIWIEPGSLKKGRFGFYQMERSSVKSTSEISKENQDDKIRVENRDPGVVRKQLRDLMVDLFKLPEETSADQIVIGSTPGWDSLRQIELILAVEKAFRIKFTSNEFILGSSLNELEKLIESKLFDQNFT